MKQILRSFQDLRMTIKMFFVILSGFSVEWNRAKRANSQVRDFRRNYKTKSESEVKKIDCPKIQDSEAKYLSEKNFCWVKTQPTTLNETDSSG